MLDQDTVRIPLFARDGSIRVYAIVDAADADFANQWRWYWCDGYADRTEITNGRRWHLRLHRELLGLVPGDGIEGDHINRDRLDNRRINLRAVPKSGNRQNKPSQPGSSSNYRGVSWDTGNQKWLAQVQVNGKNLCLGRFTSEIEAAEAARMARARLLPFSVD